MLRLYCENGNSVIMYCVNRGKKNKDYYGKGHQLISVEESHNW